ncbi:hypothetical protein MLD38_008579 [Melastoma candidum]|uniref:Uncharacterized protein n=1 Tax=Melastoma candidum TaxID=119954 RepID=A0ACB9RXV3_9MYRT|nr:hypothetical protein MLD38_008579 [Melastoma candidum]
MYIRGASRRNSCRCISGVLPLPWKMIETNVPFLKFEMKGCARTMDPSILLDRFDGVARLMVVSDLDYTMVEHDDSENLSLLRFNALWEAYYRDNSLLVYSTGRSTTIYKELRDEKPLLTPDAVVMSVGTEIAYGESMVGDSELAGCLSRGWDRDLVLEEASRFPELTPQSETEQRPFKVSFFIDKDKAGRVIEDLYQALGKHGLDVKIIYSSGIALDILPRGAGKGQALGYLQKKVESDLIIPLRTLVCGDSGNDAELFTVPGVFGVMVSNAQEELLQWYTENASSNPQIILARKRCAAGIIEAIGCFGLGPSVSPRDIRDLEELKAGSSNPGVEIVMFYLLYERWLRGEVEESDQFISKLRLVFTSDGVLVRASGAELPFSRAIDMLAKSYGDKQGGKFRVWVDKLSAAQTGSDTWLVKFNKWEMSGEKRQGSETKVLLSSRRDEIAGEFSWLHMHQTWLDNSLTNDENDLLF